MPCRDYESDKYVSPTASWEYKDLKKQADRLARIACKAMNTLEEAGVGDLLILKDDEVREWWAAHKEADRKAREAEEIKRQRTEAKRAALAKLTKEEQKLLGVFKLSKEI